MLTVAYLILGISFSDVHRSIDAIRFGSMIECKLALASMKAQIANRPVSEQSRLTFEPYCTETKPEWWQP